MALTVAASVVAACGPPNLRQVLLRSGAVNVSGAIEEAVGEGVTVLNASFSPDSERILVSTFSLIGGVTSVWVYRIEDGSLVQTGLKPGWALDAATFTADGQQLIMAVERPDPPSFRIYQVRVGSTEWANLTDLVPTSYVKVLQVSACPDGETLAVLSASEGQTDLAVSRDGGLLLETQAYPGYVKILGWNPAGTLLYVESDIPLDLGLTKAQREKNAGWDDSMQEGVHARAYAIDVAQGDARAVEQGEAPDPLVSPDGKWKLHMISIDEMSTGLFLTHH